VNFNAYDIAYGFGVGIASPFWLAKPSARRKVLRAFRERMGEGFGRRESGTQAVMIHAVSLGEINATRALVEMIRSQNHDLHVIISTTTDTGFERGRQLYGEKSNVTLIRYPLDFTPAVERTLDALRPDVVVLMELELWPNFVRECARRKIAVMLANGRLTPSSFKRYKLIKPVMSTMLQRLARICVQDQTYAERFLTLGAPSQRLRVAGTMKFDNAQVADRIDGAEQLAQEVGLPLGREPIWVCGSTGPGEEEIILREYRQLLAQFKRLRLALIPRKPERFDEVASLIESFRFKVVRRSRRDEPLPPPDAPVPPVVLGDTMGELRKFYSIADVVFVGRSLVDLGPRQHGSDMIEPAALAKPVVVGPYTANFAEAVQRFRAAEAILEVFDGETLTQSIRVLLSTPAEAQAMGQRAQAVVKREQGATARHAQEILDLLFQQRVQQASHHRHLRHAQ
jgi:3-deoxy-D-manno-octulosonic-acid transferase